MGSLRRPDDALIVEGYPTLDARFPGITVLATRATTKLLQQAERQRQQAAQDWPRVDEG